MDHSTVLVHTQLTLGSPSFVGMTSHTWEPGLAESSASYGMILNENFPHHLRLYEKHTLGLYSVLTESELWGLVQQSVL